MLFSRRDWLAGFAAAATAGAACEAAAGTRRWGSWRRWGDQGDGTYRNPVLPADVSDPDVIRVGGDYYAVSSSLHLSPGMSVLHSRDLVNWSTIAHVVPDLTVLGPGYDWRRMDRYGRGVWAGAIREHAGLFHIVFGTPDDGYFTCSAPAAAGPWSAPHPLLAEPGWDDPCPLWTRDGRAFLVGTCFADGYKTYVFPMSPDARTLDRDRAVLIHQGQGREANKLLEIGGVIYLVFSADIDGVGRCVMARRAKAPMGPYGPVRQLAHAGRAAMEPNQGGLVQAPDGRWWFFTHHGRGDWEGRAASLLPVTWRDAWPIIGAPQPDGEGAMVWAGLKPGGPESGGAGTRETAAESESGGRLAVSDAFDAPVLGPAWQWNHQPRADRWSLSERPGRLRLHAWPPVRPRDLMGAGNTLSQPSVRTPSNRVEAQLDLAGMAEGQTAGIAHFSDVYGLLGVVMAGAPAG